MDEVPGITLTSEIGHGGFGTVYLARDTVVGRDVAVKIDQRTLSTESDQRRFTREVTAAGQVSAHPNIVTLLSGGVTRTGRPYLVMELCPGGSLDTKLRESGPLPPAEALRVGIAIADALAAAHAVGILHRDVKPANILITAYGAPALADFGLASLPAHWDMATMSQIVLTPSFAAPESFERNAETPQADVYSAGATLYTLLAGRPPRWTDSGPPSLVEMVKLSQEPLPPLHIPGFPGLMDAITHATAPNPAHRTPTAAALRDELLSVAAKTLPESDLRQHAPAVEFGMTPGPSSNAMPTQAMPGQVSTSAPGPTGDDGTSYGPPMPPTSGPAPKRASKRMIALIAAAAVVLLGGGAWGAGVLLDRGKDPAENNLAGDSAADKGTNATGDGAEGDDIADDNALPVQGADEPTSTVEAADLPQVGSCWGGLVTISGQAPTAKEVSCDEDHYWYAFAVGTLDPDTDYTMEETLNADPVAETTCNLNALARHLGKEPPEDVEIAVLGPRQYLADQGDRTFACLATT